MAEYIGGRIVPDHGGVWDKSKKYEELTIVLNAATGDSYISRCPVPAGTEIYEEHYWSLYSQYSEQITRAEDHLDNTAAAIRSEMNEQARTVNSRMEAAEENVDERATAAEAVSNQNKATLEARMSVIEARQEANVHASTDADADYAAELVDVQDALFIDSIEKKYAYSSPGITDWVYNKFAACVKAVEEDGVLKTLTYSMPKLEGDAYIEDIEMYIGTIDQRRTFLPRIRLTDFSISTVEYTSTQNLATFTFNDAPIIYEGEVVLCRISIPHAVNSMYSDPEYLRNSIIGFADLLDTYSKLNQYAIKQKVNLINCSSKTLITSIRRVDLTEII